MSNILYGSITPTIFTNVPFHIHLFMDAKPEFKYERVDNFFFAHDGPVFNSYHYSPGTKDGFAGGQVKLPMADGSLGVPESGSMWSSGQAACAHYFGLGEFWGAAYHVLVDGKPDYWCGIGCEVSCAFIEPFLEPAWLAKNPHRYQPRAIEGQPSWRTNVSAEQEFVIEM